MFQTFLKNFTVLIILFSGVIEIILCRVLIYRKKRRFFSTPSVGFLILYALQYMFLGMISLCAASVFQKIYINIPLRIDGFITPMIMGALYGLVIGTLFFHLQRRNTCLEKAVSKARFNEERFKKLFNILPYGAEVLDISGIIMAVSTNSSRLLGYQREEMIGKNLAEFLHPDDVGILFEKLEKMLMDPDRSNNISEVRLNHKKWRV